jgi:hypothetical protein
VRPAEIVRSERRISRAVAAVTDFNNPFSLPDKDKLYCLSSGAPASELVANDVMRAEEIGLQTKEEFILKRLEKKEIDFFDPIKRLNLKTMASMHKTVKVTTSNHKILEYKQQGNIAFQLLVKSQNLTDGKKLDLRELLTFPLTPVPYSTV